MSDDRDGGIDQTEQAVTLTPVVTPRRAAELMGVSLRAVYGWVERGLVEIRYTPGGQVRIVEASLLRRGLLADLEAREAVEVVADPPKPARTISIAGDGYTATVIPGTADAASAEEWPS